MKKVLSVLTVVMLLCVGSAYAVSNQARLFTGTLITGPTVTYELLTISSSAVTTVAAVSKGIKRTYINPSAVVVRYKKGTTSDVVTSGSYLAATTVREDDSYFGSVSFQLAAGAATIATFVVETIRWQ